MVLVTICLYAILTTIGNAEDSFDECYSDSDCVTSYGIDKVYCYAGTCTDRCPPGYSQESTGTPPSFNCTCNNKGGFEVDGYFTDSFSGIPKCKCTKSYCQIIVYASGIGYTDGLVPRGSAPNCKIQTGAGASQLLAAFTLYLVVGTMLIFAFLNCRSASGVIYDYHRYIGLYVVGSIAVIVFVQTVSPFSAGFTRTMGFGVIIHNSAEWNFLLRLHFGKKASVRNSTSMCLMLYYLILLVAMVILPKLEWLLYVAMIQGGFLDWTLLFFLFVGQSRIPHEENWQPICSTCLKTARGRFVCWYGFAALFHLVTVEVLFVGFSLNNPILIGVGSILLVPTFLSYTYWAFGEDRLSLFCGPSLVLDYKKTESPDFTLVPFEHTSRTVDIMWQKVYGDNRINLKDMSSKNDVKRDEASDESVELIKTSKIVVQDCESFKFGVHEDVTMCSCPRCCKLCAICFSWIPTYEFCALCCNRIPMYWIWALIIVTLNATLIIFAPEMANRTDPCSAGTDYGAW